MTTEDEAKENLDVIKSKLELKRVQLHFNNGAKDLPIMFTATLFGAIVGSQVAQEDKKLHGASIGGAIGFGTSYGYVQIRKNEEAQQLALALEEEVKQGRTVLLLLHSQGTSYFHR
jgi:hypothetical protein